MFFRVVFCTPMTPSKRKHVFACVVLFTSQNQRNYLGNIINTPSTERDNIRSILFINQYTIYNQDQNNLAIFLSQMHGSNFEVFCLPNSFQIFPCPDILILYYAYQSTLGQGKKIPIILKNYEYAFLKMLEFSNQYFLLKKKCLNLKLRCPTLIFNLCFLEKQGRRFVS